MTHEKSANIHVEFGSQWGDFDLSFHGVQDTIGNQAEALGARPPRLDGADRLRWRVASSFS